MASQLADLAAEAELGELTLAKLLVDAMSEAQRTIAFLPPLKPPLT